MASIDREYTLIIPHDDACALIAGTVPHDVMVACISAVRSLARTPEEVIEDMQTRKRAAVDVPRRKKSA